MLKLWSGRGKQAKSLPTDDGDSSNPTMQESEQENPTALPANLSVKSNLRSLQDVSQRIPELIKTKIVGKLAAKLPASSLLFVVGIGGIVLVTMLGTYYLTAPESTPDSNLACKSKITGDWQTPLGKLSLEEKGNEEVLGKYAYSNFERGNIMGEFRGKLRNNVITFDWQETPKQQSLQQPKQQGKGVLVFSENCKEFYGSYGTGDSTNNFGNWQGSNIPKNMSK
jgi:hypothetical protein